jgi:hypothetical protein
LDEQRGGEGLSSAVKSSAKLLDGLSRSSLETSRVTRAMPFELLQSKLQAPRIRRPNVARTKLVARLSATQTPVILTRAGAGYGKTTALVQWVASWRQGSLAWVSADLEDNDPVVLLSYIAAALDRVSPLGPDVFEALASPEASSRRRSCPAWDVRSRT